MAPTPIGAQAQTPIAVPENPATQCTPASGSGQEGQQAAQEIKQNFEPLRGFPEHVAQPGTETAGIFQYYSEDVSAALQQARSDPEFAAAFFNELGPEVTANLIASYDAITSSGPMSNDTYNISDEEGTAMLRDFGVALGAASRSGEGCFDGAGFMAQLTGRTEEQPRLDPELAAILLSEGEYTPEAAAELGAHVLLHDDPPGYEPIDQYRPHREALMTPYSGAPSDAIGAWPTALRGLLANGASSEVLAIQATRGDGSVYSPVAERLLDPGLITSSVVHNGPAGNAPPRVNEIPALAGAILEQPITDLGKNPSDGAAMAAVESLLLAGKHYHGDVNAESANSLGELYVAFAPEILNAGEGASAFPLARNSELGRYLADSGPLQAGDGSFTLTAALGATGTPPLNPDVALPPGMPPTERFTSWSDALAHATAQYRNEVEAHGPPNKDAPGGGTYPDLNALATEVADIDGEFLTGAYGAEAIKASDIDDANAFKQQVFNVISDYVGYAVGLGPAGATLSAGATLYNTHAESAILEHFFPTDNAQRVFSESVPGHQQQLLAAQAVRIVDSAGQSGAVTLPESLRDPATGGLRVPAAGADAEQFAADLADFIESTPSVHEAVDLARSQLEERTNALDAGQYRGG